MSNALKNFDFCGSGLSWLIQSSTDSQPAPRRRDRLDDTPEPSDSEASARAEDSQVDEPTSAENASATQAKPEPRGSLLDGIASGTGSSMAFLMAMAAMVFVMARMWRRRSGGSSSPLRHVGEVRKWADVQLSETSTPLLGAPAEIRRWHVEMESVSRDLRAELDSKIVLLQATIRSAAQEAQRLEQAIAAAKQLEEPKSER